MLQLIISVFLLTPFICFSAMADLPDSDQKGDCAQYLQSPNILPADFNNELIKQYLFLNLAYPQHSDHIGIGLVSFLFKNYDSFPQQIQLDHEHIQRVMTAMERAHGAHGVTRAVSLDEAISLLGGFISNMTQTFTMTTLAFMFYPEAIPDIGQHESVVTKAKLDLIVKNPIYADKISMIKKYSATVLVLLRSPIMLEHSRRIRESSLGAKFNFPRAVTESRQQLAIELAKVHPELAMPVSSKFPDCAYCDPSTETVADALLQAMRGSPGFMRLGFEE